MKEIETLNMLNISGSKNLKWELRFELNVSIMASVHEECIFLDIILGQKFHAGISECNYNNTSESWSWCSQIVDVLLKLYYETCDYVHNPTVLFYMSGFWFQSNYEWIVLIV
jgi:hypothetical protein